METAINTKWSVCVLRYGGGVLDRTTILRDWPFGESVYLPLTGLAATDGVHRVLIDTGTYDAQREDEPWLSRAPEEEMEAVLKANMGWSLEDVDTVINTHLHYDHCGQNCRFPNARIYVQRAEWEAACHPTPYEQQYYHPIDYSKERVPYFRWRFVEGDEEIYPGLKLIFTPGHTRGSQSVLIDTEEGSVCFAGDTIPSRLNVEHRRQPSIVVHDAQLWASMDRLCRIADSVVFSHDAEEKVGKRSGFYPLPGGILE